MTESTLDPLIQEMFKARDIALSTAMTALDSRLHAMNQFRDAMQDQSARMATKVELIGALQSTELKYGSQIDALRERITEQAKPNYVVITGFATVLVSMVAALWLILGLRIDASITPDALAIQEIRGKIAGFDQQLVISLADRSRLQAMVDTSTQADVVSRADRTQLNDRVHEIETTNTIGKGNRDAQIAEIRAALVEIETQFCASDTVRNLIHAQDLRWFAMLWKKTFNQDIPTDNTFYPVVCHGGAGGGVDGNAKR